MPGLMEKKGRWRGLGLLAFLPAVLLAAGAVELLSACNKREPDANPAITKGRVVYATYCISCHNGNPDRDGTLGPAVKGSNLDLLKARVIHGTYPPGYAPKRATKIMQKLPLTEADVEALHAFLNAP